MQTGIFVKAEQRIGRPLATDVAIAIGVGLVVALARRHFGFAIGVPGHAGVAWIAALLAGTALTPRRGLATAAGVAAGLWGPVVGVHQGLALGLTITAGSGLLIDVLRTARFPLHLAPAAALAGAAIHTFKFAAVFGHALLIGIVRNVEAYGFISSVRNHVLFGLLGGLLAWGLGRGFRAARVTAIGRGYRVGSDGDESHHQD